MHHTGMKVLGHPHPLKTKSIYIAWDVSGGPGIRSTVFFPTSRQPGGLWFYSLRARKPLSMGSRRPQGSGSGSSGTEASGTGMVSTLLSVPEDWLLEVGPLEGPDPVAELEPEPEPA